MNPPHSTHALNRSTYDHIAVHFAQAHAVMPTDLEASAMRLRDRVVSLSAPARLLDLGCGAGRDLAWFTSHGVKSIGADLSQRMLMLAQQVSGQPVCQMDMLRLGFPSGCFQALWCCAALLHLPKSEAPHALAEMRRVLAPGGFLSLSLQKGNEEAIERERYTGAFDRFFARYEPEEMAALLEQARFVILGQGDYISGRHWLWFDAQK